MIYRFIECLHNSHLGYTILTWSGSDLTLGFTILTRAATDCSGHDCAWPEAGRSRRGGAEGRVEGQGGAKLVNDFDIDIAWIVVTWEAIAAV